MSELFGDLVAAGAEASGQRAARQKGIAPHCLTALCPTCWIEEAQGCCDAGLFLKAGAQALETIIRCRWDAGSRVEGRCSGPLPLRMPTSLSCFSRSEGKEGLAVLRAFERAAAFAKVSCTSGDKACKRERERESERRRVTEDREKSLREKKNEGERERRQHCRFAPWNLLPPWTPSPSLPLSTEGFGASGALMLGKACALHRLRRRAGARARRRYRALPGGT